MLKGCKTVKSDVLAELFSSIYGTLNLLDVAERLNLPRSQWVMGVAYLLRSGALVAPDGTSLKTNETGVNLLADLSRVEAARQCCRCNRRDGSGADIGAIRVAS
jgi:hypothetical protein